MISAPHHRTVTANALVLAFLLTLAIPNGAQAALIIHFDPNVASTMFQDGGSSGGNIPVTTVGQSIGWITDVRSGTPGGAALDGFVDAQQSNTKPVLANSPGGTVARYAGDTGNLLVLDSNTANIDGPGGALDTNTLTLVLAGRVDSGGSGNGRFFDMNNGNGDFGLTYNTGSQTLSGTVLGTSVSTSLAFDEYFVATLAWDGLDASLRVTTAGGTTDASTPVVGGAIDHTRFRMGQLLTGDIGDVYVFNDVSDHSAIHDDLVTAYIPEPSTAILLGGGLAALARAGKTRRIRGGSLQASNGSARN